MGMSVVSGRTWFQSDNVTRQSLPVCECFFYFLPLPFFFLNPYLVAVGHGNPPKSESALLILLSPIDANDASICCQADGGSSLDIDAGAGSEAYVWGYRLLST